MEKNIIYINGITVDATTVFDTSVKYNATIKESILLEQRGRELLSQYSNILNEGYGLKKMFKPNGDFFNAKGWLIEAFKRHPEYNGNYQIVLKHQPMNRYINMDGVRKFNRYVCERVRIMSKEDVVYINPDTGEVMNDEEGKELIEELHMERCNWTNKYIIATRGSVAERASRQMLDEIEHRIDSIVTKPNAKKYDFMYHFMDYIVDYLRYEGNNVVNVELAREINSRAEYSGMRTRVSAGQKISKVVQKYAKEIGLDKHVDIQSNTFTRADGEVITRQKDMGWNYMFSSVFSDNINPIERKGTIVISVNPLDFWTMSFGDTWASCHTIDKDNIRGIGGLHHHNGCYCGGTESYMFDNHTFIVYYLPEDFNGDRPELEDKIKRCVFYLGEDKLIQSRLYPDGRDGGYRSLADDLRAVIQKVIADLFDVPNFWKNKKGTDECEKVIITEGSHYPDYENYDDCNVSYLKRFDGYINERYITIGAEEICPECGDYHWRDENIYCDSCDYQY